MTETTRREFVGGVLAVTVAASACSAPSQSAQAHGRKARPGVLQPGPRWNGTAGSGGTALSQSDGPLGHLVSDERFTGGFSLIPGQWIHGEGIKVSALGLPPQSSEGNDINYFKEALFYLEGNSVSVTEWSVNDTPVVLYDGTVIPQGSVGFSVEIGAGEGAVTAGDAMLYCYLRGEHGLERRIEIPLVINVDRALDAPRRTAYVDPVDGTDSGDGSKRAPWKTLFRALSRGGVGDGGRVVLLRAGQYVEDVNQARGAAGLDNRRMIEVEPAKGLRASDVVITRTAKTLPEPRWVVPARAVHFKGVTLDMGKILKMQSRVGPYILAFSGSRLVDPNGENGVRDAQGFDLGFNLNLGTMAQRDAVNIPFPYIGGGVYLAECLLVNYTSQGARLYRNVTVRESTDSFAGGPGYDDVVVDGLRVTMAREGRGRLHLQPDLVVGSVASADGGTALAIAGPGGFPKFLKRNDFYICIVSGAAASNDLLPVISGDPLQNQLVVPDDVGRRIKPGDHVRLFGIWHADFCQQQGINRPSDRGLRNTTIFRYVAESPTAQLFLTQGPMRLEPGTVISTSGSNFTLRSGTGAANTVLSDDVLRLLSGPQKGEYRFVQAFDPATGSGTLLEPFSADQSSAEVGRGKSLAGFVMALSILHKTGQGFEMGQFQSGHRNFLLAHNSFISQPRCLTFRDRDPSHGHRNHVQIFNLCTRMDSDTQSLPNVGLRVEGCHFLEGGGRGRNATVRGGRLSFDADGGYTPFKGIRSVGTRPLIPFDVFGTAVDAGTPVGAVSRRA